jgi:broad specificity phosphatase PhoE
MKLILVRHGESVGNQENRLQGNNDYDLTELGKVQAELTAERLRAEGVCSVYSSPLRRAAATAEAIATVLGCPPLFLPELREYDFGELAGETYAELRQRFGGPALGPDGRPIERVYPGQEGRDVFFKRVTDCFWSIVERHRAEEKVAIVSHGGPIALLCQSVLGLPYKRPMPFAIDNCSLSTVHVFDGEWEDGRPRAAIHALNDVCHLRKANTAL